MRQYPGFSFLIVLVLILSSLSPAFALTNRPPRPSTQHDEQGNFIPNPFAEADALRYGGLFGALPAPDYPEIIMLPENLLDPYAFLYFDEDDEMAWRSPFGRIFPNNINTRNIGFAIDEPHFIPIAREAIVD